MTSGSDHPSGSSPPGPGQDDTGTQQPGAAPQQPPRPYGQPYPSQPSAQPPYPPSQFGQPYGQPPNPYPQQPYGQPPNPYPQQPYGQQPYPQQPFGQPYPGQPYPQPVAAPAQRKNPFLGRLALLLVSISAVAAVLAVIPIGQVMAQVMLAAGSTQVDQAVLRAALQSSAAGPISVFGLVMMVGTAAAVAGLVAAIAGRGRTAGIVAVVVGVLAPVAWVISLAATIYPAVAALVS